MSSEKPAPSGQEDRMEKIVALAKRRGFIYPSSEIYGGINGFWDYGPLGVELKRNIKDAWWQDLVRCPPVGPGGEPIQMVGLDCSIIMNPKVWEASGHVGGFNDPMVDCGSCKARFRADQVYVVLYKRGAQSGKWKDSDQSLRDLAIVDDAIAERTKMGMSLSEAQSVPEVQSQLKAWFAVHRPDLAKTAVAQTSEEARQKACLTKGEQKILHTDDPVLILELTKYVGISKSGLFPPPPCPSCGTVSLTEPRRFNLMFKTFVGAMEDSSSVAYLRPETAQGIFANYKNVLDTTRLKIPFGIAQIGKAFRNEINPRNFTFRSREFEQMEIEFFCHPSEADKWYEFWRDARFKWYVDQGLKSSKLRLRPHEKDELAHYARACADIEYEFPFGVSELEGVANRTDFDLKAHQEKSGRDMTYFDDETKEPRYIPYVIEPSGGVDRALLAFLCEAYDEDTAPDENGKPQARIVLRFHPRLAPVKVAIFPLVKKDGMPEKARAIYDRLKAHVTTFYDEKGAVGRRYRRQDEAGTPFCVTVDGQTMSDGSVTIRDRDTMKQDRIPSDGVLAYVRERLK